MLFSYIRILLSFFKFDASTSRQANEKNLVAHLTVGGQLLFIFCLFLIYLPDGFTQRNLISNGSFEESNWNEPPRLGSGFAYGLDSSWTNNRYQKDWIVYNGGGHAEVFSKYYVNFNPNIIGIPSTYYYTPQPLSGDSYAGMNVFSIYLHPSRIDISPGEIQKYAETRDYLQTKLARISSPDSLYCLSLQVAHPESKRPQDQIGDLYTPYLSFLFTDNLPRYSEPLSNPTNHLNPNPYNFIIDSDLGNAFKAYTIDSTHFIDTIWQCISTPVPGTDIKTWMTVGNFESIREIPFTVNRAAANPSSFSDTGSFAYIFMEKFSLEAVAPLPALNDLTVCAGEQLNLNIDPSGYDQIRWSTGESGESVTLDLPGEYWVEATIPGCHVYRDTFEVLAIESDPIPVIDTAVCDLTTPLALTAQNNMAWLDTTSPTLEVNAPGSYPFRFDDGCNVIEPLFAEVELLPAAPTADLYQLAADACQLPPNFEINIPLDPSFAYQLDGVAFEDATLSLTIPGQRTLVASSACGEQQYNLQIDPCKPVIFLPTAFSPNGDANNDVWQPKARHATITRISIFDRWGNMHFDQSGDTGWDGTANGKPLDQSVYVAIVYYIADDQTSLEGEQVATGDLMLMK
ncbi:MAG: T9SS type B sorting domain-containing protein [Saprospiraceae bacterium]